MPNWVTPDLLTALGFIGTCFAACGYAFASWRLELLWLAAIGLLLNWFGDSLDGTLARVRKIERPRYGFFLDQSLDAFEQFILAIGVGFSGFIRIEIAILTVATYFLMSILSLVRTIVSGEFKMTYGGIGLTEIRAVFLLFIPVLYFLPPKPLPLAGLTYIELLLIAWIITMVISFFFAFTGKLRVLANEEKLIKRE